MKHTLFAVDLAKSVFEIAVSRHPGKVARRHRLSRTRFLPFFAERQPAVVVMEACGSAHFWARELEGVGHEVVLLPPQHVRRYVQRNKTDQADTKALLEAYRNEEIRPVPNKTLAQQTLTALHRLRSAWLAQRTARINTVRGLLRELGFTIPVGARHVVPKALSLIEDADTRIPDPLRVVLTEACAEIRDLEQKMKIAEHQLETLARDLPTAHRLQTTPGIGLLTSTALLASIGDVHRFPSGRHFASFLGLTPREYSSGNRRKLGRISKRGDAYLRTLLIHGARTVLWHAKRTKHPDRLRAWALRLEEREGHNKAAVALANKIARIAWALWTRNDTYRSKPLAA